MQVGGAALALLAVMNDPGADTTGIDPLLFSRASGADALFVQTGGVPGGTAVEAGGKAFSFLLLGKGPLPKPEAQGDKVVIGGQTVSFGGKKIVLGK